MRILNSKNQIRTRDFFGECVKITVKVTGHSIYDIKLTLVH